MPDMLGLSSHRILGVFFCRSGKGEQAHQEPCCENPADACWLKFFPAGYTFVNELTTLYVIISM